MHTRSDKATFWGCPMKFAVLGNCQAPGIAASIRYMLPQAKVEVFDQSAVNPGCDVDALINEMPSFDIFVKRSPDRSLELVGKSYNLLPSQTLVVIPALVFTGFHPDMAYLKKTSGGYVGPFSDYSSKLVIFGIVYGLKPSQTVNLFAENVYDALQWDFKENLKAFVRYCLSYGIDIERHIDEWMKFGSFMMTLNHPKLRVIADVTRAALQQLQLPLRNGNVADYVPDPNFNAVWPVIPGLRLPKGVERGAPVFKIGGLIRDGDRGTPRFLNLEEYVDVCYESLADLTRDHLEFPEFNIMIEKLDPIINSMKSAIKHRANDKFSSNPYRGLPDFHFWRKSVAEIPFENVNPMVNAPFVIGHNDRIASAGSCFAQHISNRLSKSGFKFLVTEEPPTNLTESEAVRRSYRTFSARFGNIYTVKQLRQLFDRAYDKFEPVDRVWASDLGGFVDPFRPEIEPERFRSKEDVVTARKVHFEAVRRMFSELDVFVFTLGLTEAWRSRSDGAVFPLAPGVVANVESPDAYEFHNFSFAEIRDDLHSIIDDVRLVNPKARFILTVSPVPLVATYEKKHVLNATVASKSILRAVSDEITRICDEVMYFPSYEIITMSAARGRYFMEDLRSVTAEGVDHVMRVFFDTCVATRARSAETSDEAFEKISRLADIICEENKLDVR
jgi:hypothetical protein